MSVLVAYLPFSTYFFSYSLILLKEKKSPCMIRNGSNWRKLWA